MKPERITLAGVSAVLLATGLAVVAPSLTPGLVDWYWLFELLLVGTATLFALTALAWGVLTYVVGADYEPPEAVHGGDDIQVRILTVDAADVVQATVDSLPSELDDVHVVAETDFDVGVVNDCLNGLPVVVASRSGVEPVAYVRGVDGRTVQFERDGEYLVAGGSQWDITSGRAVDGSYEGAKLIQANDRSPMFWFAWAQFYPETDIWGS
ncbi:DUF3179 domain-containing (seleno)protein [Halomicroarcula sp. GCM10025324]|uniref:DUF3179 domain-containing (seleno)protein n=1 Tax=Haloarcula TaxID=2237 RepID=UPI0023E8BE90|nr:DUF3179 domain-containing (seleno)protein [Halomicroarcula sp. ZS-22-S1]